MGGEAMENGKSLAVTPTWSLASVITVMVSLGFFFQASLEHLGKWLGKRRSKRKALLSALEKIKDELMLFGLLSLLMGHWVVIVAKICVKSSAISSKFFPCAIHDELKILEGDSFGSVTSYTNDSSSKDDLYTLTRRDYQCPEGHEPFASRESLEQIHRLMFVLGVIHVLYSFIAVILAMIKINSWHIWEKQAKIMANILNSQNAEDSHQAAFHNRRMTRITTFVSRRTSHPWSHHKVLVWLLCFSRQLWSSINYADYMALRYGFITKHDLPLTYDFHSYMLRSMEESFRDIVGISLPLWIYAICCIFLDFHETDVYFWLSFLPAILILVIGTKLHRVVVSLAVEIIDIVPRSGSHHHYQLNLRNELFWFGKPKLILWLIQLISFQNAFEMAAFIWSLWEVNGSSCFMSNKLFIGIRLTFGVVTQFWCSFITFPLYVIVTQMDAKFKKAVVSENVRQSLHGWKRRVRAKHISSSSHMDNVSTSSSSSSTCNYKQKNKNKNKKKMDDSASTSSSKKGSCSRSTDLSTSYHEVSDPQTNSNETPRNELLPLHSYFHYDSSNDDDDDNNSVREG